MKFNVSSTSLCNRLQMISKVIASKSTLQILESVLFSVEDGTLKMTASDSETTIVTTMEVNEADSNGRFAINAKTIIDAMREIAEQPVVFNVNMDTFEIVVDYQNGHYNFVGMSGNEYPESTGVGEGAHSLTMPTDVLLGGISRSIFATADDELRPVMNGVYFDICTEYVTFVASDGHKLVRYRNYKARGEESAAFILPKKPALLIKNILPKTDGDAIVRFDDRNAVIEAGDFKLSCRLIEGRYPNYNSVIPAGNPYRVTVDRQALISALRRVSVFASVSSALIKLHIDGSTLTVSAQDIDFSTSAEERLMCDYTGVTMSIGFKGTYLLDILNSLGGQDTIIELADMGRAGVLVPAEQEEGEDLLMLLMPMMLQD
jgi:DNA polymerase-3 subunit beta